MLLKIDNRLTLLKLVVLFGFPLVAVIIFASVIPEMEMRNHWGILFAYTVLTLIGSFSPIRTFISGLTLNNAVFFSGILLYGSWVSIWSAVLEILILAFLMGLPSIKVMANAGQILTTIWIVNYIQTLLVSLSIPWLVSDLILILVYWFTNTCLAAILITYGTKIPLIKIIRNMVKDSAMTYLLLMIISELGTRLVQTYGMLALLPLAAAFIVISAVFHKYFDNLHQLQYKVKEVKVLNESFLTTMAAAIDARDPYTHGHSHRVAYWGKALASATGLTKKQIDEVYYGGILHDIGKIGIEDEILNKEGKLTEEEYDKIKKHPVIGYEILEQAGVFYELLPAIRSHHERIDGNGYPDGLKGEEIPLIARILAISDAYDAMVSNRPYRRGLPVEAALDQIIQASGTQFDAELSVIFIQLIQNNLEQEVAATNQRTELLHK